MTQLCSDNSIYRSYYCYFIDKQAHVLHFFGCQVLFPLYILICGSVWKRGNFLFGSRNDRWHRRPACKGQDDGFIIRRSRPIIVFLDGGPGRASVDVGQQIVHLRSSNLHAVGRHLDHPEGLSVRALVQGRRKGAVVDAHFILVIIAAVIMATQDGYDDPVLIRIGGIVSVLIDGMDNIQRLLIIPRHGAAAARLGMDNDVRHNDHPLLRLGRLRHFLREPIQLFLPEPPVVRDEPPVGTPALHAVEPVPSVGAVRRHVRIPLGQQRHGL
mmetsp:Transcript_32686/g.75235  ORF Transcript_32686/g.75235 Transcript_32686/m.75235 type:complete len:270 (+) Transcript_32686:654-1463(+)